MKLKTGLGIFHLLMIILFIFPGCSKSNPRIVFVTELGEITAEVYPDKAPVTTANFLSHIANNHLDNARFYRVVTMDNQPDNDIKIEVIQGGIWYEGSSDSFPAIRHETTKETGVPHKNGVLSMARLEPGTATSEFFICVGDQPELDFGGERNPDGQGFAAFGKVIGGMDVVLKIHQQPCDGQSLTPPIKISTVFIQ